jgi:hypothetical protein
MYAIANNTNPKKLLYKSPHPSLLPLEKVSMRTYWDWYKIDRAAGKPTKNGSTVLWILMGWIEDHKTDKLWISRTGNSYILHCGL